MQTKEDFQTLQTKEFFKHLFWAKVTKLDVHPFQINYTFKDPNTQIFRVVAFSDTRIFFILDTPC